MSTIYTFTQIDSLRSSTTLLEDFPSIDGTIVSGSGSNTCRNFSMGSVLIVDNEVNPSINGTELMHGSVILRNPSNCFGKYRCRNRNGCSVNLHEIAQACVRGLTEPQESFRQIRCRNLNTCSVNVHEKNASPLTNLTELNYIFRQVCCRNLKQMFRKYTRYNKW